MKLFIVSYVGLSDNYDANGYNELHPYPNHGDAMMKFKSMRDNEIANCEDEGREYVILENTPTEFRMSWSGGDEEVRIYLKEVEI